MNYFAYIPIQPGAALLARDLISFNHFTNVRDITFQTGSKICVRETYFQINSTELIFAWGEQLWSGLAWLGDSKSHTPESLRSKLRLRQFSSEYFWRISPVPPSCSFFDLNFILVLMCNIVIIIATVLLKYNCLSKRGILSSFGKNRAFTGYRT